MKAEQARLVQLTMGELALAIFHLDQGDPEQSRAKMLDAMRRLEDLEGLVGVSTPLSLFESA